MLALATAVACPVFLYGLHIDSLWVRLPAKPWPHLVLLAWIFLDRAALRAGAYARRVAVAIALCMVADILLEFRQTGFLAGMAVFLCAQLTLASAFTMRCRELRLPAALPFVLWLGAAYAALSPGLAAMRLPVTAYMLGIGLMMWRAAVCVVADVSDGVDDDRAVSWLLPTSAASRLGLLGAVVFGVSDTMIAIDRFHAPFAGARVMIILTYWAALALLAASAVKTSRRAAY